MTPATEGQCGQAEEFAATHQDYDPHAITQWDQDTFMGLVSTKLSPEQVARIGEPGTSHPKQRSMLAVHWHPEWIPLELSVARQRAMFPNSKVELVIPTQHNQIMSLGGYAGVEVDCYSAGFNRKVQLLLHMRQEAVARAEVLSSMLVHTYQYRSGQLWEFLDALVEPSQEHRLQEAATESGATEELIQFIRLHAAKLKTLILDNEAVTPHVMLKNKLVSDYFTALTAHYQDRLVKRAVFLIKAVKQIIKRDFSMQYFYRASEVIEEARSLGAGVVIPHPEQFWPILLAGYDVDGYEVWNPQSREYTEFLIKVLDRHNKERGPYRRSLLVFMGDDTHMGEKAKDPALQDPQKAMREVGLQPAWDDPAIRKALMLAGMDRDRVIEEYRERLG